VKSWNKEDGWAGVAQALGPLRLIGGVVAVACLPVVFLSDLPAQGWGLFPSQIVPAMVVFIVWALLFDVVMSRVLAAAHGPESRPRYRIVLRFDLVLVVALIVFWGPFYYRALVF